VPGPSAPQEGESRESVPRDIFWKNILIEKEEGNVTKITVIFK
jgi:hypothetical protein